MENTYLNGMFDLSGKVAVVTGASRGIGQSIALSLAKAGANLVLVSRNGADKTASMIKEIGGSCLCVNVDLADYVTATSEIISQTMDTYKRLDILVNNAGTQKRSSVLTFSMEDFNEVMNVNLNGVFALSQAAANIMKQQGGGKIINIASLLSFQGGLNVPAYAASKGAVMQLTKSFANELASQGINVNAIAPGYVTTDMNTALLEDAARNKSISERIPAGRWANPDDFMGPALFLASSSSDYIHGHVLVVDGGWMGR